MRLNSLAFPALAPSPRILGPTLEAGAASWRDGVPNALTAARVAAIPVLVATFYNRRSSPWLPASIFAACAATDFLDGYLARRWAVHSDLGAFLDPVADKLLVCSCLVLLAGALGAAVAVPTAVIVCREVTISALREWMGARGHSAAVAVGWWGKLKTATQMVALLLLLLACPGKLTALQPWGLGLLYAAAVLACTSASGHVATAWPLMAPKSLGIS